MSTPQKAKRYHLWMHNKRLGMIALSGFKPESATNDQMLVIADVRDEVGGPLARAMAEADGKPETLAAHEKRVLKRDEIPTAIMVLPITAVSRVLAAVNPVVAQALRERKAPPGVIWVAVLAFGGTTLLQTEYEHVPSLGSA